ncbi:MAG: AMP-binding protein [Treponema sp.]|nr:AMP-binding protein [Treponema sp.]
MKQTIRNSYINAGFSNATLSGLCLSSSARYSGNTAFRFFKSGEFTGLVTYSQLGEGAKKTAILLKELGVENGGKVILLSENCPQWPVAYFGIALAGAVSVPLLAGFSSDQIQNVAEHCDVSAVCISRAILEKYKSLDAKPEFLKKPLLIIDDIAENKSCEDTGSFPGVFHNAHDLATIIYTSGTQGSSKGVMLSGKNLISCAVSSLSYVNLFPHDRLLSVLPLAHSYECVLGLIAPVISGACITYLDKAPSPSVLLPALKRVRPTAMITVPLLIEKIYSSSIAPELNKSRLYKFPVTRNLAVRFAGRRLSSAFGGCIRFFGIGGAPLSSEVESFLYKARFPYSIGYGLTEAAPLVAGNAPRRFSLNSGIKAPLNVTLRIEKCLENLNNDEGEIQVKGPNVMMGYFNDEEKTKETLTCDGWLRTGDLGRIDKKGRLHILGRIKALILGPSGENIYPEEIEGLLGASGLIEESLVYSGNKGELIALVRLSDAAKTAAGVVEHALEDLRLWVNKKLSVFSRLSKIEIKYEPFEKTPTMKIKRYLYI